MSVTEDRAHDEPPSSLIPRGSDSVQKMVQMLGPIMATIDDTKQSQGEQMGKLNFKEQLGTRDSQIQTLLNMPQLEEKMDTKHFQELMKIFSEHIPEEEPEKPKSRLLTRQSTGGPPRKPGQMTLKEFQAILINLLQVPVGNPDALRMFNKQSEMLFRKVDRNHNKEISWDEFCSYIMFKCHEKDHKRLDNVLPFSGPYRIIKIANVKETIARVFYDINPSRYILVSKEGILNILDSDLETLRTFEVDGVGEEDKGSSKRRTKLWVTDALLMPNASKLVLSTTNRDLWFYDLSTSAYKSQFLLCAIPNIPMCLCYNFDKKNKTSPSLLLFGTDNGDIHILTFHTPTKGLFETPFKRSDSCWQVFFNELPQHQRKVSHQCLVHVHSDWIHRLRYLPHTETLISCSSSSKDSLVWRDIDESKKKTYTFRVSKGIDCFDFNKEKNVLVTGGVDHIVRLWDPYVTHKPIALLKGHQTSVCDVHIYEKTDKIFSFSKDGDLRAWDIKEHCCLQHVMIKLPLGSTEHGSYPIFRGSNSRILLSVENCLAEIRINNSQLRCHGNTTHSKPLCGIVYNPQLNQVITGSDESDISIWDAETGQLISSMQNVHDREELSCLAIDKSCQRLITATRDGSAAVWNISTGLIELKLEPYDESEITSVVNVTDRNLIAFVGWGRRILMYSDLQREGTMPYLKSWASFEAHKDDILTIAYYPPNVIATGSFNGDIKLWSLDRERMIRMLKKGNDSKAQNNARKPAPPIDKLLFLLTRSQHTEPVLLSSSSGFIEFWSLYTSNTSAGSFLATSGQDASILAMCTDSSENQFLTGDTTGWITLWDIETYCRGEDSQASVPGLLSDQTFVTSINSPKKITTFEAHEKAVVSMGVIEKETGCFIISASSDYTAKIFTMDGKQIGMFGQETPWQLSKPEGKRPSRSQRSQSRTEKTKDSDDLDNPSKETLWGRNNILDRGKNIERPFTTSSLPDIGSNYSTVARDSITRDIQVLNKNEYYRSRTVILDSVSKKKDTWSFLGENYNDNVRRRMNDRRHRRENLTCIDLNSNRVGRIRNPFSPFKALHTSETQDPVLPPDLPITTRMLRKGIDPSDLQTLDNFNFTKDKDGISLAPLL